MLDYERILSLGIRARTQLKQDKDSGITMDKWSPFIKEKEDEAEKKLDEALDAFTTFRDALIPPKAKPVNKKKKPTKAPVKKVTKKKS